MYINPHVYTFAFYIEQKNWLVENQHSKVGTVALANQAGRPTDQPGGCRKVVAAARLAQGPWPMAHGPGPMAHGPGPMAQGPGPMAHGPIQWI